MRQRKILSIITVTLNCKELIGDTLKSALDRKPDALEYIVVDGGSTDGTLVAIQPWHGKIDRIISEPDKGIYDAMNKGLQAARGEYVLFINAGDRLHDRAVIDELFKRVKKGPRADVYYGETMLIDAQGTPIGTRSEMSSRRLPDELKWQDFRAGMVVSHQSFIVKRDLAPEYDQRYRSSADVDWVIRCLKSAGTVENLDRVVADYLVGGHSKKHHRRSLTERFRILNEHFGVLPNLYFHLIMLVRAAGRTITGKPLN